MEVKSNNNTVKSERLLATYEDLFHEHYSALVRYAITLLKNSDEAEDMVQQVFVNLWEKNQWQNAHTSIRSLLHTTVYNSCLNKIKQEQVKQNMWFIKQLKWLMKRPLQ
ncbi:MAG: sigma factor [bacterium]|nr:sigma factor [bacterium]